MRINNLEEEKKQEWEKQAGFFQKLKKENRVEVFANQPGLVKAFRLGDRSLRCIDEGTPDGLHLAGAGILLGQDEAMSFVKNAMVDGIYSHMGCGAASLYANENGLDKDSDEVGEEWAKNLAEKTEVPYLGSINLTNLKRPEHFHNARIIYYDGSGRFDYSKIEEFPPGFSISRKYLTADYAKKEVEIALSIIFGEHGFGDLVTPENPAYLIAIGNSENGNSSPSEGEVKEELAHLASNYDKKVVVASFEAVF